MLFFARWKIATISMVCLLGILLTVPNFLDQEARQSIPGWLPHRSLNLGLDLRGGAHMLMEVDRQDVIHQRMEDLEDGIRAELAKAEPRILRSGFIVEGASVRFDVRDAARVEEARDLVRGLATPVTGGLGVGGGNDITVSTDGNRITVELTEAGINQLLSTAVAKVIEVIRKRIDELGVTEPAIQRQGVDRVIVQAPGVRDSKELRDIIGKPARMTFHLVNTAADPTAEHAPAGNVKRFEERDGQKIPWILNRKVEVAGDDLVDAQTTFDQGQPVVSFRFNAVGARKFAKVTQENIGKPFAIVLDDKIISAPRINGAILQGSGIITGGFSVQEANQLALLLRAGALPANISILEERTVGPDLGADSIAAGEIASLISFAAVIVYMALSYGLVFGMAANIALVMNLFLIIGALSVLQATLTMPGIAGIVLTIGMAVDANVLIFERIREELAAGRSPINAVEAGFRRAFVTIVDSNVTTAFAALILFAMGSGPVRGFAVTMFLGIISSMFTATLLTRMLIAIWLRRRRPARLVV
ncbi:MAG: protein translocase subunit SecD [Pseudomonadota bacterium]|nr:protein translocase subunit SecD [Pseudomonadota bacterium]